MSMESVERVAPDPFLPQPYRVERRRRELVGMVTLELAPLVGARADFAPGQFNMFYVFGVGEVAVSLSGDAERGTAFGHTVRNVGAVSGALTRQEVGVSVGVRGPFGRVAPSGTVTSCPPTIPSRPRASSRPPRRTSRASRRTWRRSPRRCSTSRRRSSVGAAS
ncbi:hypothetical protein ACFSVK_19520 [Azorhizophilus paspali]|uniref:hypothetical protein n=1 Tax=Azorhizophilus paspali TaxID=69963 RepID=UPI00363BE883